VNSSSITRERNRRGEGAKLGDEILAAAVGLLDETGSEESITLRAVARRVGISAPSIYAHFPDAEAIVREIVRNTFADLTVALVAARDAESEPLRRLRAGCQAYLDFAAAEPNRYRILFHCPMLDAGTEVVSVADLVGSNAFGTLVDGIADCIAAGLSPSTDPFFDAVALWTALHGYASLQADSPNFPWPPHSALLDALTSRLALVPKPV
jgi:AcrR family transcriptional regulator